MGGSRGSSLMVVGDIGSTFTKLAAVTGSGQVVEAERTPTRRDDIGAGVERALSGFRAGLESAGRRVAGAALASSAGGGLRVIVVGLEPKLTLEAGLRASATAGARVVGCYTSAELSRESKEGIEATKPDLVLLTGGTNGGATEVLESAAELQRLVPGLPAVVAANEETYAALSSALGERRVVRFADNVMPRVGDLVSGSAQAEIRSVFVEHVIGAGKLKSHSSVTASIRMPTPAAVLSAVEALAATGASPVERPVVVDLGGATTDVHSVIPIDGERGYASPGITDQRVTRTVEGDLGMRENAPALVAAARRDGLLDDLDPGIAAELERAAERRSEDRGFVPADSVEQALDERLASLATEIALVRHAGVLRTTLTEGGAVLQKTGRDLRDASCAIATGGVFQHSPRARSIVGSALARAQARGALVAAAVPVLVDRSYSLWTLGLLSGERREAAARRFAETLIEDGR